VRYELTLRSFTLDEEALEIFDPHPETPPRGSQRTEQRKTSRTGSLPNLEVDRLMPISQLVEVELETSRDPNPGLEVLLEDLRHHRLLELCTHRVEVDLEISKRPGKAWMRKRGKLWQSTRGMFWPSTRQRMAASRMSILADLIFNADRYRVMTGKGGMGNYAQPGGGDTSNLSLQEREAYAKVHAHDKGQSTGRGCVLPTNIQWFKLIC
jgi:hypothetical protein